MIYLLAKYTLLFLLTSLLGFALGYWWSRRNIVDVSESYEDLRRATERSDTGNWDQLWRRFDGLPKPREVDLTGVHERLDEVSSALSNIPQPEPVSLASMETGLDALTKSVRNIPAPEKFKAPDFSPLAGRIDRLERGISAMPAPADLGPLAARMGRLEDLVRGIPKPAAQKDVDLVPLTRQVASLEQRINAIPRPEAVDLNPTNSRLSTIESEIRRLDKRLSRPEKTVTPAPRPVPRQSEQKQPQPRILSAALYGKKDDLKEISGVGPKLEGLLNKNGVFYFWQVATWTRSDIEVIDERLDVFKGRISRDDWVSQAKNLRSSPDAARMPAA